MKDFHFLTGKTVGLATLFGETGNGESTPSTGLGFTIRFTDGSHVVVFSPDGGLSVEFAPVKKEVEMLAPNQTTEDPRTEVLIERLADYAHAAWSGWMAYLFARAVDPGDGTRVIPKDQVDRWLRQIATPYSDLPEDEKRSDRDEARQILECVRGYVREHVRKERAEQPCTAEHVRAYVRSYDNLSRHEETCSEDAIWCSTCAALEAAVNVAYMAMEGAAREA